MNTKHLKAKILDLAIRGKLVPQDSSEGNAADLLQKIREEKNKCHPELDSGSKQKKIKEDTKTAKSAASFIIKADDGKHYEQFTDGSLKDIEDEIPFKIPENWCWCRLKDLCIKIGSGSTPLGSNYAESGVPFFRSQNVQNYGLVFKDIKYITDEIHRSMISTEVVSNDLLLNITGGSIGRCAVVPSDFLKGNVSQHVCILRVRQNLLLPNYLHRFILSPAFQTTYETTGSGRPGLPKYNLEKMLLPLPPLFEQKRIVSAIEKAFEQIDIIEKNKLNLKTYIKQTKSKVLDLAIHGKLVEQNPQEGNAADLLKKIREEKASHGLDFANAKSRKNKQQPEMTLAVSNPCDISDNEIPFQIPENWCWCRGKSVFLPMTSRLPSGDEFKYIDIETVDNKLHKVHHPKIIKTENAPSRASRETLVGDTVFSMVRPYLTNIALITEGLSDCIASTGFYICRPNKALNSVYLYYLMISDYVVNGLNQFMKGDNSPSINGDDITEFYYPLPPLSEQKRIVAKIGQVFEQLDVLEKSMGE